MKRKHALLGLLGLVSVVGCNTTVHEHVPKLNGYKFSCDVPVTSIPPGTVVIRWKDDVKGILWPENYLTNNSCVIWTNPPIELSEEQSKSWNAKLDATITGKLDAELGIKHAQLVKSDLRIIPLQLHYIGGEGLLAKESQKSPALREAVRSEFENRSKFKYLSLITKVAMADFTYVYETTNNWVAEAKTGNVLTNLAGLAATVSVDVSNSKHLVVRSSGAYVAYSAADGLYRKYIEDERTNYDKFSKANISVDNK